MMLKKMDLLPVPEVMAIVVPYSHLIKIQVLSNSSALTIARTFQFLLPAYLLPPPNLCPFGFSVTCFAELQTAQNLAALGLLATTQKASIVLAATHLPSCLVS